MKLLRFGEAGKEKPGILLNDEIVDVSSFGEDFGESFFENDGIRRLTSWLESKKSSLPRIEKGVRVGAPFTRPSKIVCVGNTPRNPKCPCRRSRSFFLNPPLPL